MSKTDTGTDSGSFVNAVTVPVAGDEITGASVEVGELALLNNLAHEDAAKVERHGDTMTGSLTVMSNSFAAVTGTGAGDGPGAVFTGGSNPASNATGVEGLAAGGTDGQGVFGHGDGTGAGLKGLGGSTGPGVLGTGVIGVEGNGSGGSGVGVQGTGAGSGLGGSFTGGSSAGGVEGTAGSGSNGAGVTGGGDGSGAGGAFQGGSGGPGVTGTSTSAAAGGAFTTVGSGPSISGSGGPLKLTSATIASTADPGNGVLYPVQMEKAWAYISCNGGGGASLVEGVGVASVLAQNHGGGASGTHPYIQVTLAHTMADIFYVPTPVAYDTNNGPYDFQIYVKSTTVFQIIIFPNNSTTPVDPTTTILEVGFRMSGNG